MLEDAEIARQIVVGENIQRDVPGNVDLAAGRARIGGSRIAALAGGALQDPQHAGIDLVAPIGRDLRAGLRAEIVTDAAGRPALLAGIFEHVAIPVLIGSLARHLGRDDEIERGTRNAMQVEHVG
jgi:hypothetical protein